MSRGTVLLLVLCSQPASPQGKTAKPARVRVPFVGCPSDGQVGRIAPPKGSHVFVAISATTALQLAYYKSERTAGVLAPRGWHCAEVYGSSGATLYVVPEPVQLRDLFTTRFEQMTGSVIEVTRRHGDTSGRCSVARIIARIFPAHTSLIQEAISTCGSPASDYPTGPYPTDTMRYKGNNVAEYRTPPQQDGLGTFWGLGKGDRPIHGTAILVGKSPDLLHLAVRLPASLESLTPVILTRFESEAAAVAQAQ